ncbi:ABC transporter ATP-binding protein [Acholeplasma laidlawii]|uniref:ABC transporter ATP-binding protein n=1 Tax=Acholeplasma laidlawii TaxID=2148 RepID=UPI003F907AB4
MNIIEIKDLVIDYGIVRAVKGVNLNVKKGTIVALLGANGAGKTSLIRSVSGATKVKSGEILFNGQDIKNIDPYKIAGMGVKQSPEGRMILNGLTVEENLLVGAYTVPKKRIPELLQSVYTYFPRLQERRKQQASTLSGGEQQMLSIGRALMGEPEVLLLDEPSLGLAPLIVKDIFEIIIKIRDAGKTILIVEQNALQTLKIADYAYILELGKIVSEGKGQDLVKDESLINAYLG